MFFGTFVLVGVQSAQPASQPANRAFLSEAVSAMATTATQQQQQQQPAAEGLRLLNSITRRKVRVAVNVM